MPVYLWKVLTFAIRISKQPAMLQFIARENDRFSVPELMQMAIEGGCAWVVWNPGDMADGDIREMAAEIIPLCRESSTILTMTDHMDLVKELGIHGLLITAEMHREPAEVREMLGPEAIIGVEISSAGQALALKGIDVDYAQIMPHVPLDVISGIVGEYTADGERLPFVYAGDAPISELGVVMASGVSGVALSSQIAEAEDPVKATEKAIASLKDMAAR